MVCCGFVLLVEYVVLLLCDGFVVLFVVLLLYCVCWFECCEKCGVV